MDNLVALSLMVVAVAIMAAAMMWITSVIGPKSTNATKEQPFETGEAPLKIMKGHIPVKFYLVALLFVVFDVELTFLFPWAIVFRELGWQGFVSMSMFPRHVISDSGLCMEKRSILMEQVMEAADRAHVDKVLAGDGFFTTKL